MHPLSFKEFSITFSTHTSTHKHFHQSGMAIADHSTFVYLYPAWHNECRFPNLHRCVSKKASTNHMCFTDYVCPSVNNKFQERVLRIFINWHYYLEALSFKQMSRFSVTENGNSFSLILFPK